MTTYPWLNGRAKTVERVERAERQATLPDPRAPRQPRACSACGARWHDGGRALAVKLAPLAALKLTCRVCGHVETIGGPK